MHRPAWSRNWQITSNENDTSPTFPDVLCRIRMVSQCVFPAGEGQSFTANLQAFHVMLVRVVDPGSFSGHCDVVRGTEAAVNSVDCVRHVFLGKNTLFQPYVIARNEGDLYRLSIIVRDI